MASNAGEEKLVLNLLGSFLGGCKKLTTDKITGLKTSKLINF